MNKGELIAKYAATTGVKVTEAKVVVETLSTILKTTLQTGDEVTLPGIGKLKVKTRPARTGRNPATGAAIAIPEKRVVKFSPAAEFNTEFSVVQTA